MGETYEFKNTFTMDPEVSPGHLRVGDHTLDEVVDTLREKLPFHVYERHSDVRYKDGKDERTLTNLPDGIKFDTKLHPVPKRYEITGGGARHNLTVVLANDEHDHAVGVEIICTTEAYMAQRDARVQKALLLAFNARKAIEGLYTPHTARVHATTAQEEEQEDDCY